MDKNHLVIDYDRDFDAWVQQHITLLKQGRFHEMDVEHLLVELEDMGKSNLRELENRFIILIAHLLKWQFQFNQLSEQWEKFKGSSWRQTIIEQRLQVRRQLKNVPSLRGRLQETLVESYPYALELTLKETQLPAAIFPDFCPYTLEQLLDENFYPKPQS